MRQNSTMCLVFKAHKKTARNGGFFVSGVTLQTLDSPYRIV